MCKALQERRICVVRAALNQVSAPGEEATAQGHPEIVKKCRGGGGAP